MNQFGDNPYQSPEPIIRAELVEKPYQPPRAKKPWPPVISFLWLVAGPFVWIWFLRFCIHELHLFAQNDYAFIQTHLLAGAALWLLAAARTLIWVVRSLAT